MDQVTFLHKLDRVLDTSFYRLNEDTSLDFQKNHVNSVMKYVIKQCVPILRLIKLAAEVLQTYNSWVALKFREVIIKARSETRYADHYMINIYGYKLYYYRL